jgi:hypothetical protein
MNVAVQGLARALRMILQGNQSMTQNTAFSSQTPAQHRQLLREHGQILPSEGR